MDGVGEEVGENEAVSGEVILEREGGGLAW